MKKIILLIIMLFMLSGCSVNYELNISKEKLSENINIIPQNISENTQIQNYGTPVEAFVNSPIISETNEKIPGVEYYNVNTFLENNVYNLQLNYDFDWDNIKENNIINLSVSSFRIEKNNDLISFYTGSKYKILDEYTNLNNVTIKVNISNEYEISSSNADSVVGNSLIWNIDRSNYQIKPLNFTLKDLSIEEMPAVPEEPNTENNNNQEKEAEKLSTKDILITVGLLLSFIIILVFILSFRKNFNKSNE